MDDQQLNEILVIDRETLMSVVPKINNRPLNIGDYDKIWRLNFRWHDVVQGLNNRLSNCKKRAKNMNFDVDLDLGYLSNLWLDQQGRCVITDKIMSFTSGSLYDKNPLACSIDRIDNDHGYIRGNVRLLTHWANNAKSTWDHDIFESMIASSARKLQLVEHNQKV